MAGWVPPAYPHDRLVELKARASAVPGGIVDLSIGDPCDALPDVVRTALTGALDGAVGYPMTIGAPAFREAAAAWMQRRLGVSIESDSLIACVGTKEFVAGLPRWLRLRDPSRDTVLYPAVAYPTYAMGAELAGLRAVAVPLDAAWRPQIDAVDDADAERASVLWVNEPGNPTGSVVDDAWYARVVAWARERGIVVASDECYVEFSFDAPATTALGAGTSGVIAVHSLSKRSNMAGLRAGFAAGDRELIGYLGEVRKHAGLMTPGPVQVAAAAALGDDEHVEVQRQRYRERRKLVLDGLDEIGLEHDGGPGTFYLWARDRAGERDGLELTTWLADAGTLVSPGELYGAPGRAHVRIALVAPLDRLEVALERIVAAARR